MGSLSSVYPLGMLAGLFVWPALSDRVGRKPVISLSLLGSAIGLFTQSVAIRRGWPLPLFLLLRLLSGSCAAASPVSKAYLADVGTAADRLPTYMAWRDAASTLAFIVGPTAGGLLFASSSLAAVVGSASAASALASLLVFCFVSEEVSPERSRTAAVAAANAPKTAPASPSSSAGDVETETLKEVRGVEPALLACPLGAELAAAIATICAMSGLFNCGQAAFDAFFPSLLQQRLGLDARHVGAAYTALASLSFCISAFVSSRLQRAVGAVNMCISGLGAVALGLLSIAGLCATTLIDAPIRRLLLWGAVALYQVGVPLYAPTIPTMLLQCVPPYQRGAVMGLDGGVNTIARVLSPLILGSIYSIRGPSACYVAASAMVALSAALAVFRRFYVRRWTARDD